MKKILSILFFLFLCEAYANIIETPTLDPLQNAIEKADSNTLALFDIDKTIITAQDQIFQPAYKQTLDIFKKALKKKLDEETFQDLWTSMLITRQDKLVDPNIRKIFNTLHDKKIKTILLTSAWAGPFGKISSFEEWRINEVKTFGIDVSWSFPSTKPLSFPSLKGKKSDRSPVFKAGALFTSGVTKGEALQAFLNAIGLKPTKIIALDDKKYYLESIEEYCQKAGIPFLGFYYTAVESQPQLPLNEERVKFQFDYLEKHQRWIGDEDADKLILQIPNSKKSPSQGLKLQKLSALPAGILQYVLNLHGSQHPLFQ